MILKVSLSVLWLILTISKILFCCIYCRYGVEGGGWPRWDLNPTITFILTFLTDISLSGLATLRTGTWLGNMIRRNVYQRSSIIIYHFALHTFIYSFISINYLFVLLLCSVVSNQVRVLLVRCSQSTIYIQRGGGRRDEIWLQSPAQTFALRWTFAKFLTKVWSNNLRNRRKL